jgi:hypothetical protein
MRSGLCGERRISNRMVETFPAVTMDTSKGESKRTGGEKKKKKGFLESTFFFEMKLQIKRYDFISEICEMLLFHRFWEIFHQPQNNGGLAYDILLRNFVGKPQYKGVHIRNRNWMTQNVI